MKILNQRKSLAILMLSALIVISCKNEILPKGLSNENHNDKSETFKLDFAKYQIKAIEGIKKEEFKPINFSYNIEELNNSHNEDIEEQYKNSKINFGGYYITVSTSCGTGCFSRYIIDSRTGISYELPKLSNWEGNGNVGILCDKSSTILISQSDGTWSEDGITNSTGIWNWNEQEKRFETVRLDEIASTIN